jgi:4-hydroxybenzoate polyprenyltransferase
VKLKTLLLLGRTSNLPTVWTNMLAGAVLSGAIFGPNALGVLLVTGSAFYEGGMFLNDAFDAEIDAKQRPNRPIPSGVVARGTVYLLGFGLLALGIVLLTLAAGLQLTLGGPATILAGGFTCAAILAYNRWHKGHAWSPIVMGACRAGLYVTAALAVSGQLGQGVLLGAGALWLYIVGLTHIARFETGSLVARAWVSLFVFAPLLVAAPALVHAPAPLPLLCAFASLGWSVRAIALALRGQIPKAVVSLIAGVSLVDALFVSLYAEPLLVLPVFAAFLLTLKWQRRIPGT